MHSCDCTKTRAIRSLRQWYLRMRWCLLSGSATLFFLSTDAAAERIDLESYATGRDSIPIALIPFASTNMIELRHNQPWKIIADDLDIYGRFDVVRFSEADSARLDRKSVV